MLRQPGSGHLFQQLVIGAQQFGRTYQSRHRIATEMVGQQWQQLVTHGVAGNRGIVVGGILPPVVPCVLQPLPQPQRPHIEQRPDQAELHPPVSQV